MDYNVEADINDIVVTEGDTLDMSWTVYLNDVAYDMSGMQLDMDIKTKYGTVLDSFSSAGGSPEITISTTSLNITAIISLSTGVYRYDIQLTDGTNIKTIRKGNFIVQNQITT